MRLGLLGPAEGQFDALESAAKRLLDELGAERIVYLSVDGALDDVVRRWAERLVGPEPTDVRMWDRAAEVCANATATEIDAFIEKERARQRLRGLEALPDETTRVVEMIAGTMAVMVYDKRALTEDDMLPARLLLFGRSPKPLVRQVGQRWFLSPGSQAEAGTMLLDDGPEGLTLTVYDASGAEVRRERLALGRGTKMSVSGARP